MQLHCIHTNWFPISHIARWICHLIPDTKWIHRWHQIGLRISRAPPHPSSRCVSLFCWETPEFSRFGAGVPYQKLPPTVLCIALTIVSKYFTRRSWSILQAYAFRLITALQASSRKEIVRRAYETQPSLARRHSHYLGIFLAEIELDCPVGWPLFKFLSRSFAPRIFSRSLIRWFQISYRFLKIRENLP